MKTVFVVICMNNNIPVKPPLIEQVPNSRRRFPSASMLALIYQRTMPCVVNWLLSRRSLRICWTSSLFCYIYVSFFNPGSFCTSQISENICTQLDCWSSVSNTDSLDHNLGWRKLMMMAQKHLLLNVLTLYLDNISTFFIWLGLSILSISLLLLPLIWIGFENKNIYPSDPRSSRREWSELSARPSLRSWRRSEDPLP